MYKASDNLWKSKENAAAGWLLLARLDRLTKEENELGDEINQHLTSINLKRTAVNSAIKLTTLTSSSNVLATGNKSQVWSFH